MAEKKKKESAAEIRRNRAQRAVAQSEAQQKRDLFRRRVELAKSGLQYYEKRKIVEAVTAFNTYLKILEEFKEVPEGGLNPGVFDLKKDLAELLLLSGVYWDLTKLYDRTKTVSKQTDFLQYLEKFVLFSKGMPYQPLARETLRKYIAHRGPVHRSHFENAYKVLGGTDPCFIATSLMDVCDPQTITRLRRFRGEVLMQSVSGRAFVRTYYRVGPVIARVLDRAPKRARRVAGRALDLLARRLSAD